MKFRGVAGVVPAHRQLEGGGFEVRRPFPGRWLNQVDPFLLLDEMGPKDVAPGEAVGAPDHPHRGFETVTYVLSGSMQHKDSAGHAGKIGPGDVQWMTAGDGVVHSEEPSQELMEKGGRMHGFQLWVNLPRADKRMQPRYQEVPSARIPVGRSEDGKVTARVIAGDALGAHAVIDTRTPILYVHFTLAPGGEVVQPVSPGWNVFAYVFGGQGSFAGRVAQDGSMVVFAPDDGGDTVRFANDGDAPLEVLLIGGQPLREPVARYGPFVMNTPEEILEAFRDFKSGRMGRIEP